MRKVWELVVVGLLGYAGVAMAGRPLIIDDADPVERGRFELEAGIGYVKGEGIDHFDVPLGLTYGLLSRVEVGIGFGGQFEDQPRESGGTAFEEGISDLTLGFKWKLLDQDKAFFDQALAGTIKFPTADEDRGMGSGEIDYDLTYILTRQIDDRTAILFNVGYTWLGGSDESDVLHYGPALTHQLTPTLQPVAEIVFETPVDGGKTSVGINGGIRYQLLESLTLDAAVGAKLAGDWPDWTATVGLTWAF